MFKNNLSYLFYVVSSKFFAAREMCIAAKFTSHPLGGNVETIVLFLLLLFLYECKFLNI